MINNTYNSRAACPADGADDARFRMPVPGSPCWTHDSRTASHAGTEVACGPEEQRERQKSMDYVREWIVTASTEEEQAPDAQPECKPQSQCAENDDASLAAGEACNSEDIECIDGAHLSPELMQAQVTWAMRRLARLEQVGINPKELPTIRALFVRWTIANWERNNFGCAAQRQVPEEETADEYAPVAYTAAQTVSNSDVSPTTNNGFANSRRADLAHRPRSRGIDKRKGCANAPLGHIRGAGSCIVKTAAHHEREIISLSRSFNPSEVNTIKPEMDNEVMSFMLA